jgi:hypothetical protein
MLLFFALLGLDIFVYVPHVVRIFPLDLMIGFTGCLYYNYNKFLQLTLNLDCQDFPSSWFLFYNYSYNLAQSEY